MKHAYLQCNDKFKPIHKGSIADTLPLMMIFLFTPIGLLPADGRDRDCVGGMKLGMRMEYGGRVVIALLSLCYRFVMEINDQQKMLHLPLASLLLLQLQESQGARIRVLKLASYYY